MILLKSLSYVPKPIALLTRQRAYPWPLKRRFAPSLSHSNFSLLAYMVLSYNMALVLPAN
jgi:hypothetical protein